MAQLIVRNLPDDLVAALKRRAARAIPQCRREHRELLRAALQATRRRSFAQLLAAMPNVGKDEDFSRSQADAGSRLRLMYLIDTDVLSEIRKGPAQNARGARVSCAGAAVANAVVHLYITVGEVRRGVALIRHRGDAEQAAQLRKLGG